MISRVLFIFLMLCPFAISAQSYEDPWESYNRGIFAFNEGVDRYVAGPVARGYNSTLPSFARTGVKNFFNNLRYPQYLVADILQLKFKQAAVHTGRFLMNTTVGIGGLIDVAEKTGIEAPYKEDFGLVFESWGIGTGPYWVLPFLGPSTLREGIGYMFDSVLYPPFWLGFTDKIKSKDAMLISAGATTLDFVNVRAGLDDAIESARKSSVDYYLFMQSSYYQYRRNLYYDGFPPDEEEFTDEEGLED